MRLHDAIAMLAMAMGYPDEPGGVMPDADERKMAAQTLIEIVCPTEPIDLEEMVRNEAIVAKLPLTADGVPVVPGMTVWHPIHGKPRAEIVESLSIEISGPCIWVDGVADAECLYSTRAAAEAAGGE